MMNSATHLSAFQIWMTQTAKRFQQRLNSYLESLAFPASQLREATHYSAITEGKRIRPLFIYAIGRIFNTPVEALDPAAIAIELIHSYSLIHDDLPAMDNSEWRRGKPSCFKAFGEDMAILAGDGLQALAFEALATYPAPLSAEKRIKMVQVLSKASGPSGMVGGQALDILNTRKLISEKQLLKVYKLKTGALIEACFNLALTAADVKTEQQLALKNYARRISLAFQIQDDLLDIEGKAEITGKSIGLDTTLQKQTYPLLKGIEAAKQKVNLLFEEAFYELAPFSTCASYLRELGHYLKDRKK